MTKVTNTEEFEQAQQIAGLKLIALKGVIQHKLAPDLMIFGPIQEECDDLTVELQELINPGNFNAMVDTCFDLPLEAEVGEVRATKNGQIWIRSKEAWVYLTHVAGVR